MKHSGRIISIFSAAALLAGSVPVYSSGISADTVGQIAVKSADQPVSAKLSGTPVYNLGHNDYTWWSRVVNSYFYESSEGVYTRVQYTDGKVIIENYSDGKLIGSDEITAELPMFGGFFSGSDANYLVYGQENYEESASTEVIRVVKYSKNWERLSQTSIRDANTVEPFAFGSLRMTETAGKLYIYTCHKMYKYIDGENHQSNMTIVIRESDMSVADKYWNVNEDKIGYISHAFSQFIRTDGVNVYRADHGDSYPRSMYISKCGVNDPVTKVSYTKTMPFSGNIGDNATGASLGGMELSGSKCIIVGNTVDHSDPEVYVHGQRNVFVSASDKNDLNSKSVYYLTDYSKDSGIVVKTPNLVKVSNDRFIVMWEEQVKDTENVQTKAVVLDGSGNTQGDIIDISVRLSDCQPIICSDGYMRWYAGDDETMQMYCVDPYDLESAVKTDTPDDKMLGDIDGNGAVDADDASLALAEYARVSSGGNGTFTEAQTWCADVNIDGAVDADDASMILSFYSYTSTGGEIQQMENWITDIYTKSE